MEEDFYAERLARWGIEVVLPDADDRTEVDRVIFEELTRSVIEERSRSAYAEIVDRLAARGAQAVVLGCTEIGLLLAPDDVALPMIDSALVHAFAAADAALGGVGAPADPTVLAPG
jgi:aspartate racemase